MSWDVLVTKLQPVIGILSSRPVLALISYILGFFTMYFKKIGFEPVFEIHRLRRSVTRTLHDNAREISNTGLMSSDEIDRAHEELRARAGEIEEIIRTYSFHGIFSFLRLIPKREDMANASRCLIRISNRLYDQHKGFDNYQDVRAIERNLNIQP